jgi:hypothetical protein
MKNKIFHLVTVIVVSLGMTMTMSTLASEGFKQVSLHNETEVSLTVSEIYQTKTGVKQWGRNLLIMPHTVHPGNFLYWSIPPNICRIDLKVVYQDSAYREAEIIDHNVCQAPKVVLQPEPY